MKSLLFILLLLPVFAHGQIDIKHNQLTITSTSKIANITINQLSKPVYSQSYDTLINGCGTRVADGPSPVCYTQWYTPRKVFINVSTLHKGTYFVKVNGAKVGKFMKE